LGGPQTVFIGETQHSWDGAMIVKKKKTPAPHTLPSSTIAAHVF